MSKTNTPLVSVIIVNWNGEEWLRRCLDGLLTQTYSAVEIIFVDNNSSDNSVALVEKAYPSLKIIRNDKNLGFSGGNNSALPVAKGEYLLLLNTDTVVANDYIQSFVDGFDKLPAATACIQSKIVLESNTNKIDSAGSFWTNTSFLYHYGNGKDASLSNYNKSFKVFSNKGASLLIKRSAVDKIGLFDEDFWCYYEETDFCNRLWLAGYECWYYPGAIIIHAGGSSSLMFKNDYIQFHNFKNKLLSFLKNYQASTLVTVLPTYLILNIGLSIIWLISGKPRHAGALYKSIWWNFTHLKDTLKKRKKIQLLRNVSDTDIFEAVKRNPDFSYYKGLLKGNFDDFKDQAI